MAIGISLNIGLDRVSVDHPWSQNLPELRCGVNGALYLNRIAKDKKYLMADALLNEKATRNEILFQIENTAKYLEDGDLFLISFHGHASKVIDENRTERDGRDEGWCVWDNVILDDDIAACLGKFEKKVNVLVVSDCCFAAGIAEPPSSSQTLTSRDNLNTRVIYMGASDENEYAFQRETYSVFTFHMQKQLKCYSHENYLSFFQAMRTAMSNEKQTPVFSSFRDTDGSFLSKKPFNIND